MDADDGDGVRGADREVVRQPLPPEVPAPAPEPEPAPAADPVTEPVADAVAPGSEVPGREWWRAADELGEDAAGIPPKPSHAPGEEAPGVPPKPSHAPGEPAPETAGEPDSDPAPESETEPGPEKSAGGPDWWDGEHVRGEWREAWATHGQEAVVAAHEIGAHIGEAISSRLDPHAAAAKRGLDIRWMRLKYNLPGIALALLVTWGGKSATDRMVATVAEGGVFAPLGWLLLAGLLLLVLMFLPIGSWLGSMFSTLVASVTRGAVSLFGWAWRRPYIGYVLRVLVAVAAWSFIFAVVAQVWRGVVHLLTGA
ncbi:hypothetical protein ABZ709_31675 [Streptomyces albus]|uniref:hypothetical protein n=1 Tax=Streptomyces albus TaxID=1888 RepID=UPI0033C3D3AB